LTGLVYYREMVKVLESNPLDYAPENYLDLISLHSERVDGFSEDEYDRVMGHLGLQLASDIFHIKQDLDVTYAGLLADDPDNTRLHQEGWRASGSASGMSDIKGYRDWASQDLRAAAIDFNTEKIRQAGEGNDLIVEFKGDPTWRLEQTTFFTNGREITCTYPTIYGIEDGGVLGWDRIDWIGDSHLRKWADVTSFDSKFRLPPNYHQGFRSLLGPSKHFEIEYGTPCTGVVPSRDELDFFEKVLAIYI
jgi:hypothetical protein